MSDENEIIAEEIYEYYQDKLENEQTSENTEPEAAPEQQKNIFASASKAISGITDKLAKNSQDKSGLYITLAVLASVIIIMCGYITGLAIPKNDERIAEKIEELRSSDARYTEAAANNKRLNERVNTLYDENAEVKAELNGITDYEAIRDRSKQDIEDVSVQLEKIKEQVASKQSEVEELDSQIKDIGSEITLKPGMYTVGKHIAAGEYYVKGDGSILVSDSDSKLKINTKLTQSASYTCRLSSGDIIKLETEAEFNPVG